MTIRSSPAESSDREPSPRERLPRLRDLHTTVAERLSAELARLLKRAITVRLTGVDEITHGQYVFSLERPTFVCLLSSDDQSQTLSLEINHSILFPLMERLLGGNPAPGTHIPHRRLTAIEQRLAARIVEVVIRTLTAAWSDASAADCAAIRQFAIEQVATDPGEIAVAGEREQVGLVSFEISIGAARGLLNLCLPWPMIAVLASRLPEPFVPDAAADTAECRQEAAAQPAGTLVELVVEVEAGQISAEDLQALGVGDIITTSQAAAEPLIATVDGRPRFLVRPGSLGGQKAVEVQSALDTPTGESARRAG